MPARQLPRDRVDELALHHDLAHPNLAIAGGAILDDVVAIDVLVPERRRPLEIELQDLVKVPACRGRELDPADQTGAARQADPDRTARTRHEVCEIARGAFRRERRLAPPDRPAVRLLVMNQASVLDGEHGALGVPRRPAAQRRRNEFSKFFTPPCKESAGRLDGRLKRAGHHPIRTQDALIPAATARSAPAARTCRWSTPRLS
jgi:hypothetical protein